MPNQVYTDLEKEEMDLKTRLDNAENLIEDIWNYRRGNGEYNFSTLPDEERSLAALEAWEAIENRIVEFRGHDKDN